jgi:hypothetical protein
MTTKRPPFSLHSIAMLESPAWAALSLAGRRVLDRVEIELARHAGKDNGRLPVTYRDFQVYGIDRHSIRPALRELEHLGFIEITEHGVAGMGEARKPNLFRLTYRDTAGKPATDEWTAIANAKQAKRIARAAKNKKSVRQHRSRDRTKQFTGGGFYPPPVGVSPPPPVGVSPPKASKTPAKRQVENLHHYLDIYPSREGAAPSSDDPRPRSGPRPPRRRRRRRARVRPNHSKQEGHHGRH